MADPEVPPNYQYDLLHFMNSLPLDLGKLIFDLLPTQILVILHASQEEHIRNCATVARNKVADFRDICYVVDLDLLRNYISVRSHCLQVLNIDNIAFISPEKLCDEIIKCTQLTALSVKYCGLDITSVCRIFSHLQNINNFSWSMEYFVKVDVKSSAKFTGKKFQKLALDIYNPKMLWFFLKVLHMQLDDLEYLHLNFCDFPELCQYVSFNKADDWRNVCNFPKLRSLVITRCQPESRKEYDSSSYQVDPIDKFLKGIFNFVCNSRKQHSIPWEKLWVSFPCYSVDISLPKKDSSCSSSDSYFCFKEYFYNKQLKNILECQLPDSLEAVGYCWYHLQDQDSQNIQWAGGRCLRKFEAIKDLHSFPVQSAESFRSLYQLFEKCCNIAVLNISGYHFLNNSGKDVCNAICHLKGLKELYLPECAAYDASLSTLAKCETCTTCSFGTFCHGENVNLPTAFDVMIRSCKFVEVFHLLGCHRCPSLGHQGAFYENNLKNLHEWSQLKNLRIASVGSVIFCSFLVGIGDKCKKLKVLELANLGSCIECHFMTNLVTFLKTSNALNFLRIIHKVFDQTYTPFWTALSTCVNLQGLCISSGVSKAMDVDTVIDNLNKVRYFSIFHFYGRPIAYQDIKDPVRALVLSKTKRNPDITVIMKDTASTLRFLRVEPSCPNERCCYNTTV